MITEEINKTFEFPTSNDIINYTFSFAFVHIHILDYNPQF